MKVYTGVKRSSLSQKGLSHTKKVLEYWAEQDEDVCLLKHLELEI
jgi:hypothetical protein